MFLRDPDSRVRLRVGERLLAYADAGLKLHPPPFPKELDESRRDQLIAELRALYQRELPNSTYKPLVEAEDEPPAASAAELLEEIRLPAEEEAPEPAAPQVRYIEKCVSPPGHFPPRFVKIAVQTPPAPDVA